MSKVSKNQIAWHLIFLLFFVGIFTFSFWSLTGDLKRFDWLYLLGPVDITIISLASFRFTRLVTDDKILFFVRDWFTNRNEADLWYKQMGGFRRTMAEMIECFWCTGIWSALFITTAYLLADVGRFFVIILAIAALGSFFQNLSRMIDRIGT